MFILLVTAMVSHVLNKRQTSYPHLKLHSQQYLPLIKPQANYLKVQISQPSALAYSR